MKTEPDRKVDGETGTMERLLTKIGFDPKSEKPTVFTLESPIPEQGNDRTYMAHTDKMSIFLNVYGPNDGENRVHTHANEDHSFIVLQGTACFEGPNGEIAELRQNQGIMLPRNSFYTFHAGNNAPLVLLRVGATVDSDQSLHVRQTEDGEDVVGSSSKNNSVPCVFKEGAFFR
ncbi:MAG: cupin domain-containing protein [Alphaproteobacteria bacterium]|jgi:mannose-6-phosphate isomerase-like protein (cupin superfamily)